MLCGVAFRTMTPTNDHAEKVAATIRGARAVKGLTQEQFGKAIGRSRLWVTQLERARWYTSGEPFSVNPHELVRIATQLEIPAADLLVDAGIPKEDWPDLAHIRSKDDSVRTVDLTALSTRQINLIEALITELKIGNHDHTADNHDDT